MSTVLTLSQNAEPNVGHERFFTRFFNRHRILLSFPSLLKQLF